MSKSLTVLNHSSALLKALGLRDRLALRFSPDGECLYLKGKITYVHDPDKSEPAEGNKKAKVIKGKVAGATITPDQPIDISLATRVDSRRIFVQPKPELYTLGQIVCPSIIEPLTTDRIWLNIVFNEGVSVTDVEKLDYIFRVYVLS